MSVSAITNTHRDISRERLPAPRARRFLSLTAALRANNGKVLGGRPGIPELDRGAASDREACINETKSFSYGSYGSRVDGHDAAEPVTEQRHLGLRARTPVLHRHLVLRFTLHHHSRLRLLYGYAFLSLSACQQ